MRTFVFFFFNDTATTEIYTLSLHDALPILGASGYDAEPGKVGLKCLAGLDLALQVYNQVTFEEFLVRNALKQASQQLLRSEEHTSELQSRLHLVCRLLLEKKKKNIDNHSIC